jgi:Cu-Zn family superoxide dismutase
VDDLAGRVVIVHAGPDNFGNIPVGTDPNQYTPNSQSAIDRTAATGNAGDRIACGVIGRR